MALDIDLKGKQFQEFQAALMHAFPAYNPLKIMLMHRLGENLNNIVAVDAMANVVFELITWAKANGRLSDLLAGALEENPRNPYLRRFGLELTMTSDVLPEGRLQSMVLEGVPFVGSASSSVVKWKQLMSDAERCVCRVEMPKGVPRGTGFLVGKDIAITNWHVVKEAASGASTSEQITLRFDYKRDVSGAPPTGSPYALRSDWLLDSSPEKELDYALIRLSDHASDDRGTLTPQPYEFPPNHPLFILQHPGGEPMIVQVGTITSINTMHKRVNYTTNTAAGSSGSPCFTTDWTLVALHHYGQETSNMGIPLIDIKEHVRQTQPVLADELVW